MGTRIVMVVVKVRKQCNNVLFCFVKSPKPKTNRAGNHNHFTPAIP